ncbi:hypothetical protein [Streptomyces sp. XD-27]|uniref:DUF6881 domain-containing protein n=1 Tax=Streptomyces sp. XD-27 TaxID=3062779 RepID=UPI00350E3B08
MQCTRIPAGLGKILVNSIEDVKAQPDFSAFVISRTEFEELWSQCPGRRDLEAIQSASAGPPHQG